MNEEELNGYNQAYNEMYDYLEDFVGHIIEEVDYDLWKDLFLYEKESGEELVRKAKELFNNNRPRWNL